ncbi:MAG: endonuclease/exonuclease/phosphatase family protein [Gammaproteobacteria bacterium]|nr:endonuclease/exonuclease/phosphatase family protein [Gammaproteobacteria bacterium]
MKCDNPNYSHSFFQDHSLECSYNRYNSLNDIDQNNENIDPHTQTSQTNTSYTSQTWDPTFGPNPQNASTPERRKKTKRNTLNGILINTNSVKSIAKTTQLKTTIQTNNPDIIFLVETKIDENYPTYSFLPPNYNAIRKDRNAHGGGVLIAFRDDIVAEPLANLNSSCEIVWTKIHFTRNKSIYFASYYRPPSDHLQSLEALHESLTKLYRSQKTSPNVVIAGDFNLPDINWGKQQTTDNRTASKHNKLLEIMSEFGLQNMVNDPTRLDSGNILDLILTSNPSIIVNTHTTPGMSDHEAVTFNVNLNPVRHSKPPHKVFQYKYANWDKLKDDIKQLTTTYFDTNPNSRDINTNWNFFRNNLTSLVNNNIPSRNTKAKNHLPWITREIIRMQRKRNKSHKKAKQTGRNNDWERFRQLRKQATKAAAKSYSDYLNNHIGESLKTNPKRFWSFIKANKREYVGIPTLQANDQPITNDHDKANTLNNQFSSVFTQEIYPIPQLAPSTYPNIPTLEIGIEGVLKQLKHLNQNKATGPDELPGRVLKETAAEIAPIITHIFQQSYNTCKLPDDWLQALVTPIHKKPTNQTLLIIDQFR